MLFYRESDFPLDEIRIILDLPGFDQVEALRDHRRMLVRNGPNGWRVLLNPFDSDHRKIDRGGHDAVN